MSLVTTVRNSNISFEGVDAKHTLDPKGLKSIKDYRNFTTVYFVTDGYPADTINKVKRALEKAKVTNVVFTKLKEIPKDEQKKTKHVIKTLYATIEPLPKGMMIDFAPKLEAKDYNAVATPDLKNVLENFTVGTLVTKFYDPKKKRTKKADNAVKAFVRRLNELKAKQKPTVEAFNKKKSALLAQPIDKISLFGPRGSGKSVAFRDSDLKVFDSSEKVKEEEFFTDFEKLMSQGSDGKYIPSEAAMRKYNEYSAAVAEACRDDDYDVYLTQSFADASGLKRSKLVAQLKDDGALARAISRGKFPEETERALHDFIEASNAQTLGVNGAKVPVFEKGGSANLDGLSDKISGAITKWVTMSPN